ncbi:MAG: WD40/YVTN/BNR-like repeat-containing protein [Solirubrobacteraceae bacterium]
MTELVVGTKKGLFLLEGEAQGGSTERFEITSRSFAGQPVDYALRDPRSGRLFAAVTSPFYGPKLFFTDGDPSSETGWQQADGVALPEGGDDTLERIWVIAPGEAPDTLYMGADPGVLFESHDGGASWEINAGLWNQPSRRDWRPGGGGLCLHSISTWPGDPDRLAVAISAAGMWLSDDGGASWRRGNRGLTPRYLPEADIDPDTTALCVHHVERSPSRPERMFMQFHGGVYRSDDAGESWGQIGAGLPSDFGFPLKVDPLDPDSAFVIPLVADMDRVTPEGRVRVYETRDGGASWAPRGDGLPAEHAYLTVLRQAFTSTGHSDGLQLYFGATSGDIFGSGDAGATWCTAATRLPPVFSISIGR